MQSTERHTWHGGSLKGSWEEWQLPVAVASLPLETQVLGHLEVSWSN